MLLTMKSNCCLGSFLLTLQILVAGGVLPMNKILKMQKGSTIKKKNCSIHQSAVVRRILDQDFFPIFKKYGVEVPRTCKFHKDRDMFVSFEQNKTDQGSTWQCELCGKEFYELFYLYEHAKRKHANVFLEGKDSVCLATYCDIFRCDLHDNYPHNIPQSIACNKKTVHSLRTQCEALTRSCLPTEKSHVVYDKLYTAICSTLTCEKFLHPFQDTFSVGTVVLFSISIPVSLFFLVQVFLIFWESSYDPEEDEKYRRARQAEHEARNAEFDQRYYAARGGYEIRRRIPNRLRKTDRYPRYMH